MYYHIRFFLCTFKNKISFEFVNSLDICNFEDICIKRKKICSEKANYPNDIFTLLVWEWRVGWWGGNEEDEEEEVVRGLPGGGGWEGGVGERGVGGNEWYLKLYKEQRD